MHQRLPVLIFALVMAAIPFIPGVPPFWIVLLNNIGLAALVAMGLVLLTGVGGLTSFGQAAFCGFGAYTTAVLTTAYGVSPWLTLPLSLLVSGIAAVLLGIVTVRLSGHYLPLAPSPGASACSICSASWNSSAAMTASRVSRRFRSAISGCSIPARSILRSGSGFSSRPC